VAQGAAWYEKAAKNGHVVAQFNFAVMASKGQGMAQSLVAGFSWYKKAAEQGMAEAQVAVGDLYMAGQGTVRDEASARIWYEKAAALGNAAATARLKLLSGKAALTSKELTF
jgi:TPR repeat protein